MEEARKKNGTEGGSGENFAGCQVCVQSAGRMLYLVCLTAIEPGNSLSNL